MDKTGRGTAGARPFFSIVSVTRNDAWGLTRTARSVARQTDADREYLIVDGASDDGTPELAAFWQAAGLVDRAVSEPDSGVYNGMNKALGLARGEVVCFLNSGDVFARPTVLEEVRRQFDAHPGLDGILGWGELNGQYWTSWAEDEAVKMASLGFCHQALFVRRTRLAARPFDERRGKTDSDTRQLGQLYADGADIAILPEVLAIRGGEPGISADLERTRLSIRGTLVEEYPALSETDAETVIAFRRRAEAPEAILALMARLEAAGEARCARHLAYAVLDTLFQRQAARLDPALVRRLADAALGLADAGAEGRGARDVGRLIRVQTRRAGLLDAAAAERAALQESVARFEAEEEARLARLRAARAVGAAGQASDLVVSLTSFPARLATVRFVIRSLLEQTVRPARIQLWLGRDEVPALHWLPGKLRALQDEGLEIHLVPRTRHQYDKYLHNAALNETAPLVIVDDDVIYPADALERLRDGHAAHPGAVVANRCHRIGMTGSGGFAPYAGWTREQRSDAPSFALMPTGAGGVLYPPGFLTAPEVTDTAAILGHAPYADDIWLKACALARGIPTFATVLSHGADWYHRYTPTMRAGTLMEANVEGGLNDVQLARVARWLDRQRPDWRRLLAAEAAPRLPVDA